MSVSDAGPGSLELLATALGLVGPDGQPRGEWFGDPTGDGALGTLLARDVQREALVEFVDDVLGPPDADVDDDTVWVPLFREPDAGVTISAVVATVADAVHVGIGIVHEAGDDPVPRVASTVHVPVFRVPREGGSVPDDGLGPSWLLLGSPAGNIEIECDVTLSVTPPAAGEAHLAGAAIRLAVPTGPGADLGLGLVLRGLQLPGGTAPRDHVLDAASVEALGPEALELLLGLVRAQADAASDGAPPRIRAVLSLLGLRSSAGVPPLPLEALLAGDVTALVSWFRALVDTPAARTAWFGQLATLLGGTVAASGDAVEVAAGPASVVVGLRVVPGVGGAPVLVPTAGVRLSAGAAAVEVDVDVCSVDTGTGAVVPVPRLRAQALFGSSADPLLTGDPAVEQLRIGVHLVDGAPAFALTLHEVSIGGRAHPLIDLSTPDAVTDAAGTVVGDVVTAALGALGPQGALVSTVLGIDRPDGIAPPDLGALFTDPLGFVAAYWQALLTDDAAMREALGALGELLTGAPVAVTGDGSATTPWSVPLTTGIALTVTVDGGTASVALAAEGEHVDGDSRLRTALAVEVLQVDLTTGESALARSLTASVTLDDPRGPLVLELGGGLSIGADAVGAGLRWSADGGFLPTVTAPGLAIRLDPRPGSPVADLAEPITVPLTLPTVAADGTVTFTPDLVALEQVAGALLSAFGAEAVDVAVALSGWTGQGPRLRLDLLLTDPVAALRAWAGGLLTCGNLQLLAGPLALLTSGGTAGTPLGEGSATAPLRFPLGGDPAAPGPVLWSTPRCPPGRDRRGPGPSPLDRSTPLEPQELVAGLEHTARTSERLDDLLRGRVSLATGIEALLTRLAGTDGLVGAPLTVPDGVTSTVVPGHGFEELVALGAIDELLLDVLDDEPSAVLHVGVGPRVADPATALDATVAAPSDRVPASAGGVHRAALASARTIAGPGIDVVAEQAARIEVLLADRTAPIVLVAYGEAGAPALRAAASRDVVTDVVTVGTPWGATPVATLTGGLGGDARLLLTALAEAVDHEPWPSEVLALEASPVVRGHHLLDRLRTAAAALATVGPAALADASAEALRPGLGVHAVFGSLDRDPLLAAVEGIVRDGVDALQPPPAPPLTTLDSVHAGVGLPVLDVDVGGVLVGAGVTWELASLRTDSTGLVVDLDRAVIVDVELGVTDGWLVGGPGAPPDSPALRWLEARIRLPESGGGEVTLTLHEARALGVERARWTLTSSELAAAATDAAVTAALPEARVLLGEVVRRVESASAPLADLLRTVGVARAGGLDTGGLDRLLHDPAATLDEVLRTDAGTIAAALRALTGAGGSGTTVTITRGGVTAAVDLATRGVHMTGTVAAEGLPPVAADVAVAPGSASVAVELGAADARAGGLVLRLGAGTTTGATAALDWHRPGVVAPTTLDLLAWDRSVADELLAAALPATLLRIGLDALRSRLDADGRATLLAVERLVGVVVDGRRLVPVGLFDDPVRWLLDVATGDPATDVVALLDIVGPLVLPGSTPGRWAVNGELGLAYDATGGRLLVAADVDITAGPVTTGITAGMTVGTALAPVLDVDVVVDGRGLRLRTSPTLSLALVRPAAPPLSIVPPGPGLGAALLATGAEMVAPPLLDALADQRTLDDGSVLEHAGELVFALGGALDLLDTTGSFEAARLRTFADDPAGRLLARLPHLAAAALRPLGDALVAAGLPGVALDPPVPPAGPAAPPSLRFGGAVAITIDDGPDPAVVLSLALDVPDIGRVAVPALRLSGSGVQTELELGPVPLALGPVSLFPLVRLAVGVDAGGFEREAVVGLAAGPAPDAERLELRWGLDASPPRVLVVRPGPSADVEVDDPVEVATALVAQALSVATGVLTDALDPVIGPTAVTALRGVVFLDDGTTTVDPAFVRDLVDPDALWARVQRLALNLAAAGVSVTIDGTVEIGFTAVGDAGDRHIGLQLSMPVGTRLTVVPGETQIDVEVDPRWIEPEKPAGLTVLLLREQPDGNLDVDPGITVAGIGLRVSSTAGPLVDLGGLALDAIALHAYAEASAAGTGGGVRLLLDGLAFQPSAGGGSNPVANSILSDAEASPSDRPSFSPSLAVQQHPGDGSPRVTLRAGDPPGPWWLVVQRQLGPLYVEQIGFDAVESGGRVSRVTLLFDGGIELFGLSAAVDDLSLTWNGGDPGRADSWSADLAGLAIAADLSGINLAGGLLKSTDAEGNVGYVGMLVGRFGTYGLSVFGGYTSLDGDPSFFVFGAVNGPLGGPPAFFLTGLGGGLGINRGLNVPRDLSEFGSFPFLRYLDPGAPPVTDPLAELRSLNDHFPARVGEFWFAAGISFTSFNLVDGVAVIAVAFGNGLELNLLGLARMALPRPGAALVSIELALLARFSTREGVFLIQAQLTDNSWLLYEDVRLTGGFVFATWWKGPLKGHFVVSLGGYHPEFVNPGYPDVPRLGLEWRISDAIVVKGGSYFALTSEALMAGVEIEVSADFGWAWARIRFGAHGIVYFDPFAYAVTAYASISAGVKIKTFFGTISFSAHLGASVTVRGPEFHGSATIEIGPADFTVRFGDRTTIEPPAVPWAEFVTKYLEDGGAGSARALSGLTGAGTLPASTDGQDVPPVDGSRAHPYEVYVEFAMSITTTIPATGFVLAERRLPTAPELGDGAATSLGLAPMRAIELASDVMVTLQRWDESSDRWVDDGETLALMADTAAAVTDAYPVGVWGLPQPADTADAAVPTGDPIVAGRTLHLRAEVTALQEGPAIDYYRVDVSPMARLPLQADAEPLRRELRRVGDQFVEVAPGTAAAALDAGRARLFDRTTTVGGTRSVTARVGYGGSRTAPPLLGSLADRVAERNGEGVASSAVDGVEPVAAREPRPPRVIGLMTSGAAPTAAATTTVADARTKRRPAPSTASVRGRLGVELPIRLQRSTRPAAVVDGTVTAASVVPHTGAPGVTRSLGGSIRGSARIDGIVSGLRAAGDGPAPHAEQEPTSLRPGDVVTLQQLDAAVDAGREARPTVRLTGSGRFVALATNGDVLADVAVADGATTVPRGARLLAVQADPIDARTRGWHDRSRLAHLGERLALGTGCVVRATAPVDVPATGWTEGARLVDGVPSVLTTFSAPPRTVAVILGSTIDDRPDRLAVRIDGATADGDPTSVLLGDRTVLVYALRDRDRGQRLAVRVRAGGDWELHGVVGSDDGVDALAAALARRGPSGVVDDPAAATGRGCTVAWEEPG